MHKQSIHRLRQRDALQIGNRLFNVQLLMPWLQLRFSGSSTAYQRSLRSQWRHTGRWPASRSHWPIYLSRPQCSRLVLYRYIENIEISIRYRYIVSYRIAGRNIEIFDISRYQISIFHFAEFSFIYSFSPRFDSLSPGISIWSCSLIEPIRHCLLT